MACCLMAPSDYLNQCWLIISMVLWRSSEGNYHEESKIPHAICKYDLSCIHIYVFSFIYGNLSYQVPYKITWTTQKWQDYSRCNTWELVPVNDVSFIGDVLFSLCWLCFCVLLLWQRNDMMYMCLWHKWQIKTYKPTNQSNIHIHFRLRCCLCPFCEVGRIDSRIFKIASRSLRGQWVNNVTSLKFLQLLKVSWLA